MYSVSGGGAGVWFWISDLTQSLISVSKSFSGIGQSKMFSIDKALTETLSKLL